MGRGFEPLPGHKTSLYIIFSIERKVIKTTKSGFYGFFSFPPKSQNNIQLSKYLKNIGSNDISGSRVKKTHKFGLITKGRGQLIQQGDREIDFIKLSLYAKFQFKIQGLLR